METIPVIRVVDLVGKPIAGRIFDVRTFNADGSLRYDHVGDEPHLVRMKAVEIKRKKDGKWLYWTWEPNSTTGRYDCGFSGIRMDSNDVNEYHIGLTTQSA